jgi:guanine deaminase
MVKNQAKTFSLKGNILYSESLNKIISAPNSYLVCENGKSAGIFDKLPEHFKGIPVKDWGNTLIIPGLVDLHMHAPQYSFCGIGMDQELLDWLNNYTFPEEAKYADFNYAAKAYKIFSNTLAASATTHACIFATVHVNSTCLLMELLEKTGVQAMVGKINMDRNCPQNLKEISPEQSLKDTERWLDKCKGKYKNIKPILTPRFTPSCTDDLLKGLGELQKKERIPLQSHLSENRSEIDWVHELCPNTTFYGETYDRFGLLNYPAVMAHCVYSSDAEIDLLKRSGVFVAHCPQSNTNLASGIAPIRAYLNSGLNVGLGTDVAAGFSISIFRAMSDAIQASKLRWCLVDNTLKPLSIPEVFYLGTKGGGKFFGKVGSFEKGYNFDAVVLDDANLLSPQPLDPVKRLERIIYLSNERNIAAKYVSGIQLLHKT